MRMEAFNEGGTGVELLTGNKSKITKDDGYGKVPDRNARKAIA